MMPPKPRCCIKTWCLSGWDTLLLWFNLTVLCLILVLFVYVRVHVHAYVCSDACRYLEEAKRGRQISGVETTGNCELRVMGAGN